MFWKKIFVKLGRGGVVFIGICFLLFIVMFFFIVGEIGLRLQPMQKEHAQVAEKIKGNVYQGGTNRPSYSVIFAFPDGSKKEFKVNSTVYDTLQENDTGVLFYKERKSNIEWIRRNSGLIRSFISFEKDNDITINS